MAFRALNDRTAHNLIFAPPMIQVSAPQPLQLPGLCDLPFAAKKKCCKKYKKDKRCKDCPKK
jgi:hypothetical protein